MTGEVASTPRTATMDAIEEMEHTARELRRYADHNDAAAQQLQVEALGKAMRAVDQRRKADQYETAVRLLRGATG